MSGKKKSPKKEKGRKKNKLTPEQKHGSPKNMKKGNKDQRSAGGASASPSPKKKEGSKNKPGTTSGSSDSDSTKMEEAAKFAHIKLDSLKLAESKQHIPRTHHEGADYPPALDLQKSKSNISIAAEKAKKK